MAYTLIGRSVRGMGSAVLAGAFFAVMAGGALAETDYPTKPVTLVVPFVPGGMVDTSGRIIAEKLSEVTGQQFIVENRSGAAGSIGYSSVAKADPDGYTVLVGYSTTSACAPSVNPNLPWKPDEFTPIASFAGFPLAITINPSIPARTLPELIEYLKAHGGEVSYGALGVGSQVHIATEMFKQMTGTDMVAVQYKGSGEVIADLLAGNVQFVFDALGPYRQHIAEGTLISIAVADTQRDPGSPDLPTFAEAGLPGLIQTGFMPLYVPAGTDPAIVAKLSAAVEAASHDEAFREKVTSVKLNNSYRSPDDLNTLLTQMSAECADVVQKAGIKVE